MTMLKLVVLSAVVCMGLIPAQCTHALGVTQPAAGTVVAVGDDYATQVLGNAWDMSDSMDVDTEESSGMANQAILSGAYSGDTTGSGAYFYPLHMGYPGTVNLSRGANFPIDTSHYRYVTMKIRATVTPPSGAFYSWRPVFLKDGDSYNQATYGFAVHYTLTPNTWQIMTLDMISQIDPTSPHPWTEYPQVTGLRIDPATQSGGSTFPSVHVDVAWIRLTAPATAAQKTAVQWTDSGYSGKYAVSAIDSGGVSYPLGNGISGTSYAADLSFLAPGQYTIRVTRSDNSANANSATFRINAPPQIAVTAPSMRGEQSLDFAKTVVGNPWGPIDSGDFSIVQAFTNVSYSTPVNSFYGRPISHDPGWFFNQNGHSIDTNVYRSLCYTMEVFGQRDISAGSIARVFWGNGTSGSQLTTSKDIPLHDNVSDSVVSEYCIADLAPPALIDMNAPSPGAGGTWSGTKAVFRIDPDEFTPPNGCSTSDTCHDVRLDSVTLSPFALANPSYTFNWTLTDPDSASDTVDVYLDPDATPLNGNEIHLGSATMPTGNGQFAWSGSCANALTYGPWHVLMAASDGIDPVSQYAGGPILISRYDGIFRNGFESIPANCP